jgi:hypothetical protein
VHETSRSNTSLLLVSVGDRMYGLPVTVAHDVLKVRRASRSGWTVCRPAPYSAPSGAPVDDGCPEALVDLREHLGLPPAMATRTRTMVVIQSGDRWLGLLVDAVAGIVEAPRSSIGAPPASKDRHPAVRQHVRVDDRPIGLLDPEYLLPVASAPAATTG